MDAPYPDPHADVRTLAAIALARLPRLVDHASGLMVFRADGPAHVTRGTSVRYTAMTALGIERADAYGLAPTLDRGRLYEALDATLAGADDIGAAGLVLWAAARDHRALAERALRSLLEFEGFRRQRGGDAVHSTELAWTMTGLAEALAADLGPEREVRAQLDAATRRLLDHRGASGLVCFARPVRGRAWTPRQMLHAELGFFDAQVYSIVALLRRNALLHDAEARAAARRIGEILLAHQQPLGQWAWHYNVRSGRVVDVYPVYAVHQDAMAPMALLPLERACGISTAPAVARGVGWLFEQNELGERMALRDSAVIWRSIRRREPLRRVVYPLKAASLAHVGDHLNLGARLASPSALTVDREFRPYHFGLCLYAFAELAGSKPARIAEPITVPMPAVIANGAPLPIATGAPAWTPGASKTA